MSKRSAASALGVRAAKKDGRKEVSFDTVREMGLALPDVDEGTVYGSPALKVRGKMFACLAVHRSAEPDTLVRLTRVHPDALRDLLLMAWHFVSASGKRRGGQPKRKSRASRTG